MYKKTSDPTQFDDAVDWSERGRLPTGDFDPNRTNPFLSDKGTRVTVSHRVEEGDGHTQLLRRINQSRDEGDTEFPGSFAPGARLLSTVEGLNDEPLMIEFSPPVAGVGARLVGGTDGQPFTGILRVYDSTKKNADPVGESRVDGITRFSPTETAPFLGVIGDESTIVRAEFDTAQDDQWGFVIDSLRLLSALQ